MKDTKAWLVLSNKMDRCYLLVNVQEIRIQPYFCVKQGDYFFSLFLGHPVCHHLNFFKCQRGPVHGNLLRKVDKLSAIKWIIENSFYISASTSILDPTNQLWSYWGRAAAPTAPTRRMIMILPSCLNLPRIHLDWIFYILGRYMSNIHQWQSCL